RGTRGPGPVRGRDDRQHVALSQAVGHDAVHRPPRILPGAGGPHPRHSGHRGQFRTTGVTVPVEPLPALYPRLLGAAWEQVAPAVRLVHLTHRPVRGPGLFRVGGGPRWLARLLAAVLRLPTATETAATLLTV